MNKGNIVRVSGPVVDVEFREGLPAINNALKVECMVGGQPATITLEVQQQLGDSCVQTVSMSGTEGLKRGYEVIDTGAPISVPVGEAVMGRVFDVTGAPIDERGPVKAEKYYPIHRLPPPLVEQSTSAQVLPTGIKVIDLISPFLKGGKVGAFGGAGPDGSAGTRCRADECTAAAGTRGNAAPGRHSRPRGGADAGIADEEEQGTDDRGRDPLFAPRPVALDVAAPDGPDVEEPTCNQEPQRAHREHGQRPRREQDEQVGRAPDDVDDGERGPHPRRGRLHASATGSCARSRACRDTACRRAVPAAARSR